MVVWEKLAVQFIGIMMLITKFQKHVNVNMLNMFLADAALRRNERRVNYDK
ncbi:hypothetical protein ACUY4Q_003065 [Phytobacter sp. AG2a]